METFSRIEACESSDHTSRQLHPPRFVVASDRRYFTGEIQPMFDNVRLIDLSVPLEHDAVSEPMPAKVHYVRHDGEGLQHAAFVRHGQVPRRGKDQGRQCRLVPGGCLCWKADGARP
jgi:hypothetical protein